MFIFDSRAIVDICMVTLIFKMIGTKNILSLLCSSRYFKRKYSDSNKNKTTNNDIAYEAEHYYKHQVISATNNESLPC